jgi:signal peptidase I
MKRVFVHAATLCCALILIALAVLVAQSVFHFGATAGLWALAAFVVLVAAYILHPRITRNSGSAGRDDGAVQSSKRYGYGSRIIAALLSVLLFVLFRTFAFHPFSVSGNGMRPNFAQNAPLIIAKFAYGYSRFTFPLGLAGFSGRFPSLLPSRGDVIVYRNWKKGADDISRVIGLPGDRIQMVSGIVLLNGTAIPRQSRPADPTDRGRYPKATLRRETVSDSVSYDTLDLVDNGIFDNTAVFEVGPDAVFVLGDNRDNVIESRILGSIPMESVIGKVVASF